MKLYLKDDTPIARSYPAKDGFFFEEGIGKNKNIAPCVMNSFNAYKSTHLYSSKELNKYERELMKKHQFSLTIIDDEQSDYNIEL